MLLYNRNTRLFWQTQFSFARVAVTIVVYVQTPILEQPQLQSSGRGAGRGQVFEICVYFWALATPQAAQSAGTKRHSLLAHASSWSSIKVTVASVPDPGSDGIMEKKE